MKRPLKRQEPIHKIFEFDVSLSSQLSLDTARGVADASHVVVVGIRKAYVDYELFERVETKVASMHDCSSLFDVGCPLARERELVRKTPTKQAEKRICIQGERHQFV